MASTPHARGSTPVVAALPRAFAVYPACAGIHPARAMYQALESSLPRMRGDPPRADP